MSIAKFILCAGAIALVASAARADSFGVKTGAWESTVTSTTTGTSIPPDMLSKLPPDQRAKIEQMMRSRSGQPHTITRKYCVTQKDLDEDRLMKEQGESQCSRKVLSKSSTRLEIEQTCGTAPHAMTMHVSVQATSPARMLDAFDVRPMACKRASTSAAFSAATPELGCRVNASTCIS